MYVCIYVLYVCMYVYACYSSSMLLQGSMIGFPCMYVCMYVLTLCTMYVLYVCMHVINYYCIK